MDSQLMSDAVFTERLKTEDYLSLGNFFSKLGMMPYRSSEAF
jgi:hypothetical protein